MINVSLESLDAKEAASYRDRYKTVYVNTKDFGVAAAVAKQHVGAEYMVSSMSEDEGDCLDAQGEVIV